MSKNCRHCPRHPFYLKYFKMFCKKVSYSKFGYVTLVMLEYLLFHYISGFNSSISHYILQSLKSC